MIQNHVPDPDQEVAVDQDHVVEDLQRTHQYVEKTARWRIRGQGLDPNLNPCLNPKYPEIIRNRRSTPETYFQATCMKGESQKVKKVLCIF